MSSLTVADARTAPRLGVVDRIARRVVLRGLGSMSHGVLDLEEPSGTTQLGHERELHVTVRVNDPQFFRAAMAGGTLSVAESYLRGDWDCDDLTSLFRVFIRNRDCADRLDRGLASSVGRVAPPVSLVASE